jgi:hypothetical protein
MPDLLKITRTNGDTLYVAVCDACRYTGKPTYDLHAARARVHSHRDSADHRARQRQGAHA